MSGRKRLLAAVALLSGPVVLTAPAAAWAQDASTLDTGDTAWMLMSCALVMLMTPGLALFYGGLVRSKNVLNTIMMSLVALGVMSLQWVVVGYSLAFGDDISNVIGNPASHFLLNGVSFEATGDETIPPALFAMFQGMFIIITPALISGAIAERMKFKAYVLFIVLWGTAIYAPICHWVWHGEGWLYKAGALDFAGGTVVHISSGVSALVAAILIGPRHGYHKEALVPHSLVLSCIGAGLLWFGWFGFNAGSALAAGSSAVLALTTTHIGAASGLTGWALIETVHRGKASALGVISGLVAGLVGITPAAGFVNPTGAIVIGFAAAAGCYAAVTFKERRQYDDALDAFGVHGIGGTVGAILTGVFAVEALGGTAGLLEGNAAQMWPQIEGVLATAIYAAVGTVVLLQIVKVVCGGLRALPEAETQGLDLNEHGESGYVS